MKDLEGKELERGAIYHILGSGTSPVIAKFSHETEFSFVFKSVKGRINEQGEPIMHSWKRIINKWWSHNVLLKSLPVVKVSQEIIDKYAIT